jgi:hypothetical protein
MTRVARYVKEDRKKKIRIKKRKNIFCNFHDDVKSQK